MMFGALALPAHADDHLSLGWEMCRLADGESDMQFPCSIIGARRALVCSFMLASPVDSVIGAELDLDIQSAATPLPDYWRFDLGGCTGTPLVASFPTPGGCADPWGGLASALVQSVLPGEPRGQSSQERFRIVISLPSIQARVLDAGVVYDAVQVTLSSDRITCAGCDVAACLVLNSVLLRRLPGALDVMISGHDSAPDNYATWQGGVGADCLAVPARARTWGNLKVRYR